MRNQRIVIFGNSIIIFIKPNLTEGMEFPSSHSFRNQILKSLEKLRNRFGSYLFSIGSKSEYDQRKCSKKVGDFLRRYDRELDHLSFQTGLDLVMNFIQYNVDSDVSHQLGALFLIGWVCFCFLM